MNILKFIFLFLCSMGTPSIVQADLLPNTTITHETIPYFTANERVVLDAQLNDTKGITTARCYFRTDLDTRYLYVSMNHLSENNFQCFLPAFSPGSQTLEYFFLIANGSGQVIRSTPYVTSEAGSKIVSEEHTAAVYSGVLNVYSELGDTMIENTSIIDNQIRLMPTQHSNQLYGLRAGIDEQTVIPDSFDAMSGYFGGFILNPADNTIQPTKGFAPNMKQLFIQRPSSINMLSEDNGIQETSPQPVNIAGDDWVGFYYRTDSSYILNLSASISEDGPHVTITTTKSGLGHYLTGSINAYNDMLLYDSYDGEDWTTHYGPASSTQVKIYDYAWPFVAGEPTPPLYAIILYRPPQPPSGVTASDGTFQDKVAVNWNLSDGASSYLIYACSSALTDSCKLLTHIPTNQYDDTREIEDKIYYRIKACDELCSEFSNYDTGFPQRVPLAAILHLVL